MLFALRALGVKEDLDDAWSEKSAAEIGQASLFMPKFESTTGVVRFLVEWNQRWLFGSPAWIRTTIHGSKGRCPTIRRPGIKMTNSTSLAACPCLALLAPQRDYGI